MSTPLRVLCIDPGETTGWAILDATADTLVVVACGQSRTWHEWSDRLLDSGINYVVVERFSPYRSKVAELINDDLLTAWVVGVAHYLAERMGIPVIVQPASLIHYHAGSINPVLTREIAPLSPGSTHKWRHVNDALAHGVYAVRHGGLRSKLREHTNASQSNRTPSHPDPPTLPT